MPPTAGAPGTIGRRLTPAQRDAADRRRIVRHLAADPNLLEWLRGHTAKHLETVAAGLDNPAAADTVRRYAQAHREGVTDL